MNANVKKHEHIYIKKESPSDKEMKFRRKLYPDVSVIEERRVQCTACLKDIKHIILYKRKAYNHKHLDVLLCKDCYTFYEDGDFSVDEDGLDKYCRWCGQGGQLYICSECPCAFCKKCIKQNLARSAINAVEADDWKCFMCNDEPLRELKALCWAVNEHIQNLANKRNRSAKKLYKSKLVHQRKPNSLNAVNSQFSNNNLECKQTVQKAKLTIKEFEAELNCFCSSLKRRIEGSIENTDKIETAQDVNQSIQNVNSIIKQSFQTLKDFQLSVNNYKTKWEQELEKAVNNKPTETIVCSPEIICLDDNNINHDSECEEILSINNSKTIKTYTPQNKNNKPTSLEPSEILEVILDDNDEDDHIENNVEKSQVDENKSSVPRIRIKNVDELNGVVKSEKDNIIKVDSSINSINKNSPKVIDKATDPLGDPLDDSVSIILESDLESSTCNLKLSDKTNGIKKLENNSCQENNNSKVISKRSSRDSIDNGDSELDCKEGILKPHEIKMEEKKSSESSDESLFSSDSSDSHLKIKKRVSLKKKKSDSDCSTSKDKSSIKKQKRSISLNLIKENSNESSDSSISFTKKKNQDKRERKAKHKKETNSESDENPKTNETNYFSSSEDDLRKLLNLPSLDNKRKYTSSTSSSNSGSDSSSTKKDTKKIAKKAKIVEKELSLLDCLGGSDQESDCPEKNIEDELELPSLSVDYNSLSLADHLLQTMSHSDDDRSTVDISSDDEETNDKSKKSLTEKPEKDKADSENKKSSSSGGGNKIYKYDKLLSKKLTDTDSSEAEEKWRKHKLKEAAAKNSDESNSGIDENRRKVIKEKKRKNKKGSRFFTSDSSDVTINSDDDGDQSGSEEQSDKKETDKEKTPPPKNRRRRRIKQLSSGSDRSSGDEAGDGKLPDSGSKSRRNIRKVLREENLQESTQTALKEEEERKKRIAEKQKLYNTFIANAKQVENDAKELDEVVLDFDPQTKKPLLAVDKKLVKKLKPHQGEGIKFMWDSCFESLEESKKSKGSGCILAHCMGLGKSLQVVTLLHTLLTNPDTGIRTALIVSPVSTVLNWVNEFDKWLKDIGSGNDVEVFHMGKTQTSYRVFQLKDWHKCGGVMVMGYNLYRILANEKIKVKASAKAAYRETLVDPGPDIVICDEGHLLKNEQTAISLAMNKIKTKRRIVLTGTPLQNNLVEYHCMVQFVKPNLLGTKKEFKNRFVHPIQNGQFEDSTAHDVKVMKRRAHVLHKMLDGIVQRKDYNVLTPYLPPKYEYVIHLKLSELQCTLYRHYLDNMAEKKLFIDFQSLMRICIHPQALLMKSEKDLLKEEDEEEDSEGSLRKFIDDGSDSSSSASSLATTSSAGSSSNQTAKNATVNRRKTRATAGEIEDEVLVPTKKSEWWSELVSDEQLEDLSQGTKIFLFFVILRYCEEIGDKLLVFSQSLFTLDVIEYFLNKIDEESQKSEPDPGVKGFSGSWAKGLDYFRLDGGSSFDNRNAWCKAFNSDKNTRARLFLISTRAGGLGINLTGANRVIIFDASWNPSFDVQSLFRVFRFGQSKPCYIYRFLSKGTMEEKIYERQVAKLSTALRVIDEHQIDRHFSSTSLQELYNFDPEGSELRATPVLPKDRVMAELVQSHSDIILSYHQHDSLLENQEDEELTEEERKAAWAEFENEKQPKPQFVPTQLFIAEIEQKLKEQMPNSSDEEIKKRALEILHRYQQFHFQQQHLQQQQQHKEYVQKMQQQFQQKMMVQQMQVPPVRFPPVQQQQKQTILTSPFNSKTYQPYRFPAGVVNKQQFGVNPKAAAASVGNASVGNASVVKPSTSSTGTQNSTEPVLVSLLSDD